MTRYATLRKPSTVNNASRSISTRSSASDEIAQLFEQAAAIDPTMALPSGGMSKLPSLKIKSQPYSKAQWLKNMADGKIGLFDNYPMPVRKKTSAGKLSKSNPSEDFLDRLMRWKPNRTFLVQTGPSRSKRYLKFPEMMKRWAGGKAVVSATDIHVRGTAIEKMLDIETLTHINLLPSAKATAQSLEMLSLVISTAGNLTDSHTDDVDGSNYCFCGKKLWLAWDTHEGLARGLEDCDRSYIDEKAEFNMKTFLSLKSAMWFTVSDGQMLFLPGNYAHKVVTFENYIGVGGFYIGLPNILSTMASWEKYSANWELDNPDHEPDVIRDELIHKVKQLRKNLTKAQLNKLGLSYALDAIPKWQKQHASTPQHKLAYCNRLIEAIQG